MDAVERAPEAATPAIAAEQSQSGFRGPDKPMYEDYARCIHCGLCLNHCPTYRLWGMEADSPRGRIRQMVLVDQGRLPLGDSFVQHMDACLDCRACETACPSGVEYGKLAEAARAQIEQNYRRPAASRFARSFVYRHLLPYPGRIAAAAKLVRFYQRSGLQSIARRSGLLRMLGLAERERLMPLMDSEFFFSRLGQTFPAKGERRARVALFAGCIAQVSFSALHEATIRVLTANGCEVVAPKDQRCCGALAAHAGVRDVARDLARINLDAFLSDEFDAIIINAAGCGSTLKEYDQLLGAGDVAYERARAFRAKTYDATEFLDRLGMIAPLGELQPSGLPQGNTRLRVTYQDSCHLLHGQKIGDAPRRLIRAVPGVDLVEMRMADHCCGSAGVYNVTETRASLELLVEKMQCASDTGAETIVTANPGCLLQMRAGVEIHGTGQQVLHVMELLDRSISAGALAAATSRQ